MNLDNIAEEVIQIALIKAMRCRNTYVTPEHILFAMSEIHEFTHCMSRMGGIPQEFREELSEYIEDMLPVTEQSKDYKEALISDAFSSVVEIAAESAQNSGNEKIGIQHILWGIYQQNESFAVYYLEKQIGDKERFLFYLQEELEQTSKEEEYEEETSWSQYATNLNAIANLHNPLIGRDKELDRAIWVLMRKDKNNPLFVGEPGVGKTSLAYGLAMRIENKEVPDALKNAQIFSLDLASLVAGTQYRGEFEKRIKEVMDAFSNEDNPIVFLDEIHNLVGAGALNGNTMDASNLLKPYLEDGSIRFIGTTSYEEYRKYFSKNTTLVRRFQNIDVKEPNEEETVHILEGLKKNYEQFHGARYAKGVIPYAVSLSKKYINGRFLPDKAIDLMDEAGAYRRMKPILSKKIQMVDRQVIETVLAQMCNIPEQTARQDEVSELSHLYERITKQIFGQDNAARRIVDAIYLSRAGLLEESKPIASFLFVGPTGVGKTEMARVLASELGISFLRFDMSEYAEKHTVAKLIGSPAGYVGYEDGGLLTDAVRKTPHCVLLLDEMEKAHPDIYNVLLQVLDYASLTDNRGQKADFKNVIIIMTSNAGARLLGKQAIGFGGEQYNDSAMMEEVKRVFSPEFRNRLSAIVPFNHMSETMAQRIAQKKVNELLSRLSAKQIMVTVQQEALQYITEKGITREYGAREIERVINSEIKPLFVSEILFGKLRKGGSARLLLQQVKKEKQPCIQIEKKVTQKVYSVKKDK